MICPPLITVDAALAVMFLTVASWSARSVVALISGWAVMLRVLFANAPMLAATLSVVAPLWVAPPSCSIVPAPPPVAAMVLVTPLPVIVTPVPATRVSSLVARAVFTEAMVARALRSTVSTRVAPVPVIAMPPPAAVKVVIPPATIAVIIPRMFSIAPLRKTFRE